MGGVLGRINRYIMECKLGRPDKWKQFNPELIDTLWNVNLRHVSPRFLLPMELIDTLWNVNSRVKSRLKPDGGINRYIMECKLYYLFYLEKNKIELIDTLWNVNL